MSGALMFLPEEMQFKIPFILASFSRFKQALEYDKA